jgi:5'-nucleotidase/UDP-sugar diphosphatase
MMTSIVRRTLLCVAAGAAACASLPASSSSSASADSTTVTIVHFSDMHEMVAGNGGRLGGIARVASVVERERRAHEGVLVTLGGDYLSPSALSTARVDGQPLAGRQAVATLNLLGVDWATFGNHEFDLTEAAFRARLAETRFGLVSTNVTDAAGNAFAPALPSTITTVRAGGRAIRIGLVGLTIDFTIKPYVKYLPAVESARAKIKAMTGKTDAIIALTHLGLPGDLPLAEAIPEIDLILGGHEHENTTLRRGPGFTTITKGDSNAKSVVIATLAFGATGTRPVVTTRLEQMNASIRPQPAMEAEVRRWTTAAFAAFRQDGFEPETVVATIPEPLDGRDSTVRVRPGNLTELITAAIAREAGALDLAILNGGSIRLDDVLMAGPVTEYDIIRILPFGGKVLKATIDGALLSDVLAAGLLNQGIGGYLHPRGATRQNGEWRVDGKPIDPKKRYVIAVPEYLLTGEEARLNFLKRTNPMVHDVQELSDIRQAVIAELKARYPAREAAAAGIRPVPRWHAVESLLASPVR